jgi:outer membrane receptor protein involved in Fe transport
LLQRFVCSASAASLALAAPALAQQPAKSPPPKSTEKPTGTVGEIVVEGTPPPIRMDAEKKSYSLADDLQATTGSVGDALRNVPSVEVDVQGNVALRGDPNVTIMIDGKPSGMFKGEGRGQALQSLPADQIERVEVITNPSAAYNPEGTGGIINLITKKNRKPGVSGSVRANLGTAGRMNGGVSGSYRNGRLSLTGDASVRHDKPSQRYTNTRELLDPGGGDPIVDTRRTITGGAFDVWSGRVGLDFDVDDKTRLSAQVRYQPHVFTFEGLELFDRTTAAGVPRSVVDSDWSYRQGRSTLENTVSFSRKYGEGHDLNATFTRELNDDDRSRVFLRSPRLPPGPPGVEDSENRNRAWRTQLKVDYARPLGDAKLKLGYEYNGDDNDYLTVFAGGLASAPAVVDPTRSNLFKFDQRIHAAYGTYEKPIRKLTALAGLRLESTQIDLELVTPPRTDRNDYIRLYPSLHLGYQMDEAQQLTASYSRRVQRPQPTDYNPFPIYLDAQNLYRGNPDLKPQVTDSFELGYQYRKSGTIYLATAYYRNGRDAVNDLVRNIGDGVALQTRENIGTFQAAGLELVANGKLPGKVTYNASVNAGWSQIDASDLGFGSRDRSGYSAGGRASLNWQASDKDFLQIQGFAYGKRLLPQGHSAPQAIVNIGYRHKFSDQLSGVVTVQDAFKLSRWETEIDTPTYHERFVGHPRNRTVFVGVTYNFGGGKPRDQGFDFGSGN